MTIKSMFRRAADSTSNAQAFISEKLDDLSITSSLPTEEKDPNFGTSPIIKTFYEGKGSHDSHYNWSETPPKQLKEKTAKAYDRVAIKLYKIKDREKDTIGGRTPLKNHSIDIQSPLLVSALKPIVQEVGVFLDEHDVARFAEPFKPLFFCYDKIFALRDKSTKDFVFKEHLGLLTQLMTELFGGMRKKLRNLQQSRLINFQLAWTYFPKGSIIVADAGDCERLFRVCDTAYVGDAEGKRLEIACEHIVFTGMTFGWAAAILKIPTFGGNVPITSLLNYPLEFHADVEGLKTRLTTRGKKVLDYQGLEYREYNGTGLDEKCKKYNVSCSHANSFIHFLDFNSKSWYFTFASQNACISNSGDNTPHTSDVKLHRSFATSLDRGTLSKPHTDWLTDCWASPCGLPWLCQTPLGSATN